MNHEKRDNTLDIHIRVTVTDRRWWTLAKLWCGLRLLDAGGWVLGSTSEQALFGESYHAD